MKRGLPSKNGWLVAVLLAVVAVGVFLTIGVGAASEHGVGPRGSRTAVPGAWRLLAATRTGAVAFNAMGQGGQGSLSGWDDAGKCLWNRDGDDVWVETAQPPAALVAVLEESDRSGRTSLEWLDAQGCIRTSSEWGTQVQPVWADDDYVAYCVVKNRIWELVVANGSGQESSIHLPCRSKPVSVAASFDGTRYAVVQPIRAGVFSLAWLEITSSRGHVPSSGVRRSLLLLG